MGRLLILPCPQGRIYETKKEQTRTITERANEADR